MSLKVRGIYKNGTITLLEPPPGVGTAEVVVTFLDGGAPANGTKRRNREGRMLTLGMFKTDRPIDEDDFRAAEWRGDPRLNDGN
jgi:hypothetical protein